MLINNLYNIRTLRLLKSFNIFSLSLQIQFLFTFPSVDNIIQNLIEKQTMGFFNHQFQGMRFHYLGHYLRGVLIFYDSVLRLDMK